MILNFDLTCDIDLGFSIFLKALLKEWDGPLTWNERGVSR